MATLNRFGGAPASTVARGAPTNDAEPAVSSASAGAGPHAFQNASSASGSASPAVAIRPFQSPGRRRAIRPDARATPIGATLGMRRVVAVSTAPDAIGRQALISTIKPSTWRGANRAASTGASGVPSQVASMRPGAAIDRTNVPASNWNRARDMPRASG